MIKDFSSLMNEKVIRSEEAIFVMQKDIRNIKTRLKNIETKLETQNEVLSHLVHFKQLEAYLEHLVLKPDLDDALKDLVSKSDLDDALKDLVSKSDLDDALKVFITSADLEKALDPMLKKQESMNAKLSALEEKFEKMMHLLDEQMEGLYTLIRNKNH